MKYHAALVRGQWGPSLPKPRNILKITDRALVDSLTAGKEMGEENCVLRQTEISWELEGWLSTARSTGCFSKGPGFDSQHLHGSPQWSSDLHGHQACMWRTYIHARKTSIHIKSVLQKMKRKMYRSLLWDIKLLYNSKPERQDKKDLHSSPNKKPPVSMVIARKRQARDKEKT